MPVTYDVALEEHTGTVVAHRADCPTVRALAAAGEPVVTLFGCSSPLPADMTRHSCLDPPEKI